MIGLWITYLSPFLAGVLITALGAYYYSRRSTDPADVFDPDPQAGDSEVYQPTPVPQTDGYLTKLKRWRQNRREKKALKKGYIRWHLVGSAFSAPRYVKPEYKEGGNVAELEYDNETYLFPEEAMVPDAETGAYVCVHREGKGDPLTLGEGVTADNAFSIGANTLKELIELKVTSERPGGFGLGFIGDLSPQQMLIGVIGIVIGYSLLSGGI